ncbi:EAL domain-containing protein [Xanthobacter autotrophicus DSM 431]|uniref:bifunctional diguanylate cyclase/phosphodiesterase n=1 Tax=Xanthobacter nonsaccharivorans TaxID=3119912 RepID=UPI003729C0A1
MIWHRLKLIVGGGMVLILVLIGVGTAVLVDRGETASLAAAEAALERSSHAVENALNRQFLQVHGALASLPSLFAAARSSPDDAAAAGQLLRSVNFQTLAFRDLLLVGAGNVILASARMRPAGRVLPIGPIDLAGAPTALIGPVRNTITGDWSLYLVRSIPDWSGVTPVAEVPLGTLMNLLSETSVTPGARILLARPNGQLIAALPHDEVGTGKVMAEAHGGAAADGKAFAVRVERVETIAVVRASLYDDVRVVLAVPRGAALADWTRDRDRMLYAAASGGVAIVAFAATLLVALRQRERAEADRARAATVLANAVDAMSDGFAMWDKDDRLVTCNQNYRDFYPLGAPLMVPGARFEKVLRESGEGGSCPEGTRDPERHIAAMLAWHRSAGGPLERRLADGRWVLMKESRTADGGIVSIHTDITALKTTLANLADAIEESQRQNEALIDREGRIRFLAHHDDLTGLANRVLFRDHIQAALRAAQAKGVRMALLYLDLDRFKDVNDTLGHPVGDALLCAVAARLRTCAGDFECARLSGDEFAVVSLAPLQPQQAEALGADIIEALSRPYTILGHTIVISVSVGIAVAGGADADADALLKQADLALYQAKGRGRGTLCVFAPEMEAYLRGRIQMEADLRDALAWQQFELVYQPIYALASEQLCGFEALLRWNHPRLGLINPVAFVPLAEETGLIADIGTWVVRQACADARLLPQHARVAVNLSPVQLASGRIVEVVAGALRENRLDAARLELEITETALFAESQRNRDVLQRLKGLGVRIVLDDFGTGYSSLSHLRVFSLDKIKIDRSFVQDMSAQPDSTAIVEAITGLARRLGIASTAEGIETAEQLEIARRAGCTEVQGHYLGRPLPLSRVLADMRAPPLAPASPFGDHTT